MSMVVGITLFGGFGAVVIALAVMSYKRNQERIAALASLAASKGWQFSAFDPWNLPDRWQDDPFGQGFGRRATNVVSGEVSGHPMVAFDYEYKTQSTDSKGNTTTQTHCYAVYALGMPCALPYLEVSPESVFSRLGQALGMQDIELESEDFNRKFRVRCHDPKLATDVLTPRTMQLLLQAGGAHFRFAGTDIVGYDSGHLTAVDLLNATAVLAHVLHGVPGFVWKDYGLGDRQASTPSPGSLT
jgi:hypothetical protein